MQQVNPNNKAALQKIIMQAQQTQNQAALRQMAANPFIHPFLLGPMA